MRAVVIYESLTGNTAKAAELIGQHLVEEGVSATVFPTTQVNFQAVADADLVIVGSWTDGLFFFAQKPAKAGRLSLLPLLNGKKCAVFCTFALDPGQDPRQAHRPHGRAGRRRDRRHDHPPQPS